MLSNQLDMFIHHLHIRPILIQPSCDGLQGPLKMNPVISNHSTSNDRILPGILQFHLCRGDIKLFMQADQEGFEPPALLLL